MGQYGAHGQDYAGMPGGMKQDKSAQEQPFHGESVGGQPPTLAESMALRMAQEYLRRNSVASNIIQTQL